MTPVLTATLKSLLLQTVKPTKVAKVRKAARVRVKVPVNTARRAVSVVLACTTAVVALPPDVNFLAEQTLSAVLQCCMAMNGAACGIFVNACATNFGLLA